MSAAQSFPQFIEKIRHLLPLQWPRRPRPGKAFVASHKRWYDGCEPAEGAPQEGCEGCTTPCDRHARLGCSSVAAYVHACGAMPLPREGTRRCRLQPP